MVICGMLCMCCSISAISLLALSLTFSPCINSCSLIVTFYIYLYCNTGQAMFVGAKGGNAGDVLSHATPTASSSAKHHRRPSLGAKSRDNEDKM